MSANTASAKRVQLNAQPAHATPAAITDATKTGNGLLGIVLFFVGAVLLVNGLSILGQVDAKGTVPLNLFVGAITLLVNVYFMIAQPFGAGQSQYYAGTGLLFSFTYLWSGINNSLGLDGRGFGWFCLFVALSAVPTAWIAFKTDKRFAAFWASWGALWFCFFLMLSLGVANPAFVRFVGYATVAEALVTCWVPGYLLLIGKW